jgi:hypothetical protein
MVSVLLVLAPMQFAAFTATLPLIKPEGTVTCIVLVP